MKDALVALGMGGPDSLNAVRPFLENLLSDRRIIDFGVGDTLQRLAAKYIAAKRAKVITPIYAKMGGATPQLKHTDRLLAKVANIYMAKTGRELDTYKGMCYWHPFIGDTMKKVLAGDYSRIFLFPMYPHYSRTTTGACYDTVFKSLDKQTYSGKMIMLSHFYDNPNFNKAVIDKINGCAADSKLSWGDTHLLFSAHSLPESIIKSGDPYAEQIRRHAELLATAIKPLSYSIAYQSKVGRKKWLTPSLDDEIKAVAKKGVKNIILYAISFINDHIETIMELDESSNAQWAQLGLNIVRVPSLNDDGRFAMAVFDMIANDTPTE